ncbi:hypothetical protein COCON_G00020000 [Conger conger]|uniref:5-azacytidine-induced protein 1 n=1 Tax=Conger conger TaxID=82655 RepID=A0A9Q1DWM4_CONCO|nr:hypothetical protein COCON_G00020000 [Conger conger]
MHAARSPGTLPVGGGGDGPDLCLSGSQLSVSRRPSSASSGKHFSRSVSVSVAGDGRGKRNTLAEVGLGSSRSIKNLRRSNSTTQVNQRAETSVREEPSEDFLSFFDRSLDGRRKLASLSKTSPDRTTWNILVPPSSHNPPALHTMTSRGVPSPLSSRSAGSVDSPTGQRKREAGVALAPNFTANNRSNKGAVGNAVTTILHNNHSDQPLTPKSSNQRPSFNNILKATAHEESPPAHPSSPTLLRRREVTEEEAERFIQQVNHAVVTIQRWYRCHAKRQRTSQAALERLLSANKKEQEQSRMEIIPQKKKPEDRKRVREEKARLAQQQPDEADTKAKNTDSSGNVAAELGESSNQRATSPKPPVQDPSISRWLQDALGPVGVEEHQQGALSSTLTELLDSLRLLEGEPEPRSFSKEKYAWIDEAKLRSIISFLDEMEQAEQDPPRSVTSGSHREVLMSEEEVGGAQVGIEQAVATAAEVTTSMMSLKLQLEEKKRTVNMLQSALAQQRELTLRHVKETERELGRNLQQQKEQYESTIQRHLGFIDQLIDDKKVLSERCETMVTELKQVDQKYTKKITQMQEQHDMEIKKLKELMSANEKVRREKWINEKTKKIKEITQLQEEEKALQQQRRRLYKEVGEEKERLNQLATRQREELDELRRQLDENSAAAGRALREELEKTRQEQDRRHQVELKALKERLEIEKQAWEENYMKKEEAWLLGREREMKEEVRRGRDQEIELAIQRLEAETSGAREECERAAENRVKRVREQYECELREMELTERALQDRHKELKLRHSESEAQQLHLQATLRQRELDLQDLSQIRDRLVEERRSLAEVIRQEFAERLVVTEEENRVLKEEELAEVHQRVKSAILKKEETVSALRKQHEAALKRADHLEALLEQQRKQLLGK